MVNVHITFISDFICPWCYIGKVRLAKIKEKLAGEIELRIDHKPYVLYPQIPKGGLPKEHFAKKTKPGMGRALRLEAEKEEIEINYKYIERIPYSLEAHRLIWLVKDLETKYQLATLIFHGYFEERQNIEDHAYLEKLAKAVKVEDRILQIFRSNNAGEAEVNAYLQETKEAFIRVVPTIKLDHQFLIPGLQDIDVWENYIRRAAEIQKGN